MVVRHINLLTKLAVICYLVVLMISSIYKTQYSDNSRNDEYIQDDSTIATYATIQSSVARRQVTPKSRTIINLSELEKKELYRDDKVDEMINRLRWENFFLSTFWNTSFTMLVRKLASTIKKKAETLSAYSNIGTDDNLPAWKLVHQNIRRFSLYDPDDPNVNTVLDEMSKLPIISMETSDDWRDGTQFKMVFNFQNGGKALAKPMRYPRDVETNENLFIFDDMERHVAEIAAFQLDKLLGFCRVPPTIGRKINITSELRPISPKSLNKTFFYSPARNLCFYGSCQQFCNHAHAFCGHPDTIEVSMQSFLPTESIARRKSWKQPWRRAYSRHHKAYWEIHDDLCISVRNESPFNNGKMLQDIIDVHTFDFLTGNKDRHNIATFRKFGNYSFPVLYDNGRGFGRQNYDAMSILAPLKQCCLIRKSTFLKYAKLYTGQERLSSLMEDALHNDPVAPVLIQGHLNALDRRLVKILHAVAVCLDSRPVYDVIIADEF